MLVFLSDDPSSSAAEVKSVYFVNCLKIAANKSCAYLKKHYAWFAQKTNSSCFLENWFMIKTLVIDLMQVVA